MRRTIPSRFWPSGSSIVGTSSLSALWSIIDGRKSNVVRLRAVTTALPMSERFCGSVWRDRRLRCLSIPRQRCSSRPSPLCIGLLVGKGAQHVVGQCPRCCLACASGREYGVHLDRTRLPIGEDANELAIGERLTGGD